jgi:acyl-CoA synthetase (AMP-forming)/AMP-acid ligase II
VADLPHPLQGPFAVAHEVLRAAAVADPDREAFVDGGSGERITFGDWNTQADAVVRVLRRFGVARGDIVSLILPSSIDYAVVYQAAMRLGAITSGINPRLGVRERAYILEHTRPKVTIVDPNMVDPDTLPKVSVHTVLRESVASWRQEKPVDVSTLPALSEKALVAIVWTSGTTGMPKGAMFDHRCLRAMAAAAGELTAPGDRKLSPLPFAHIGYMTRPWDEVSNFVTTVICATPWKPDETLALIERERVTVCQGVPTQYEMLFRQPGFDTTDFSSIRIVGMGAARIPPEMVREATARFGAPCVVRFASTESSVCTGTRLDDDVETIANTVGRPGAGVELELRDDEGRPVAVGEVGTVCVRSRAQMRGYWKDPDRTTEAIDPDGWLITGDLGRFDERGVLSLVGRRTEMYIRSGYNVYPAEIENLLGDHPLVARIAIVGVPTSVVGEMGVAYVVPAGDAVGFEVGSVQTPGTPGAGLLDSLRSVCRAELADYKAPERLVLVSELPLTSMLKVDKRALAAHWAEIDPPESLSKATRNP